MTDDPDLLPEPEPKPKPKPVTASRIVAIGASAGGLSPLEDLFDRLPIESGCAFVVVQHLSPDFRSMMDELLGKHTAMPIRRVEDGMPVEADTVYLNLPRMTVTVERGCFSLQPSGETPDSDPYHPIDLFFGSVAEQYRERLLAVVLSGTGSDGRAGAALVKQFGGQVVAQSPESARFESMPRAVIDARLEDADGSPDVLAALITRWSAGERVVQPPLAPIGDDPLAAILRLVKRHTGLNFELYKTATVSRRIERRAVLAKLPDLADYYRELEARPDELDALYADMLIEVTSFFRDKQAFEEVERLAMPALMNKLREGDSLRLWVAGCASGEEAYSLAILLLEHAQAAGLVLDARILATDAHGRSLGAAGAGRFASRSVAHLDPERVKRFFDIDGEYVQIKSHVRKLLLFSTHDVIRDTPFTRIDLLSCRNLLIYLNSEAQEQVIAKFHFALQKEGFLFLGPSESTVGLAEEFRTLDPRWRLYSKIRNVALHTSVDLPPAITRQQLSAPDQPGRHVPAPHASPRPLLPDSRSVRLRVAYHQALEQIVSVSAPPGFLLTSQGDVVHVFGDAGKLVPVNSGAFTNRISELIETSFKPTVISALHMAQNPDFERFERRLVVSLEPESPHRAFDIILTPLRESDEDSGGRFLVLTVREDSHVTHDRADVGALQSMPSVDENPLTPSDRTIMLQRIRVLEDGLHATEESLQNTIQELEASNEELQSTNEELTSSNEELQSTNEELQSTNEELHSVNEELFTVSAEHQRRTGELVELTGEMDQLLEQSEIGTLHLDSELCVRRYSQGAQQLFKLSATNLSRAVDGVVSRDPDLALGSLARQVLQNGEPWGAEVCADGRYFLVKMVANRDPRDRIIGVLVTSIETTALHMARNEANRLDTDYQAVVEDSGSFLVRWSAHDMKILYCNDRYASMFSATPDQLVGRALRDMIPAGEQERFFDFVAGIAPGETQYTQVLRTEESEGGATLTGGYTRALTDGTGAIVAYQSTGQDLSERYSFSQALDHLSEIIGHEDMSRLRKRERLLELGMQALSMRGARADSLDGDYLTLLARAGDEATEMSAGDSVPRSDMPEDEVLGHQRVIHRRDQGGVRESDLGNIAPRSYIEARVPGPDGGTVSVRFTSTRQRDQSLGPSDESLALMLANWIALLSAGELSD